MKRTNATGGLNTILPGVKEMRLQAHLHCCVPPRLSVETSVIISSPMHLNLSSHSRRQTGEHVPRLT